VERWFTNCGSSREALYIIPGLDIEGIQPGKSRVGNAEERVFIEDDKDWMIEGADLEWFKEVAYSISLGLKEHITQEQWKEFEDALGGADKKWTAMYPNLQIIATRK
jgi:hypothetical protein